MSVLRIADLVAGYELAAPIVRGVTLTVAAGEIVALLGANGAGKSTLLKALAGLLPVTAGTITLDGVALDTVLPHRRIRHGLALVPQTENVFPALTVAEHLAVAAAILQRSARPARIDAILAAWPELPPLLRRRAGTLSGGQRQIVALARALIPAPRVLMLDEPSAGLSPRLVAEVLRTLSRVRAAGIAVLLVEQNVRAARAVADREVVLDQGRVLRDGPAR